jgi:hypothetical protein
MKSMSKLKAFIRENPKLCAFAVLAAVLAVSGHLAGV